MKGGEDVIRKTLFLFAGMFVICTFLFSSGIKAELETDTGVGFYGEYLVDSPSKEHDKNSALPVLPQTGDHSPLAFVSVGIGFLLIALLLMSYLINKKRNEAMS